MSFIDTLQINNFRNLSSIKINLSPRFNLFYGLNGAGKTSLLEAIHYLGLGKSFRTHLLQRILQEHSDSFSLIASLKKDGHAFSLGVERGTNGLKRMRLDGTDITRIADIAQALPLQCISTHSYRLLHDGPKERRKYLDWIAFHVEHSFLNAWQQLERALKQRNILLKTNGPKEYITVWDEAIIAVADTLDQTRANSLIALTPIFNELAQQLLPGMPLSLRYYRGWGQEYSISEILRNNLSRDLALGYTQQGPQRADIQAYSGNVPAKDILSQGQQKLLAYAMHLAQGILFHKKTKKNLLYLIDDLPSELDSEKSECVKKVLLELNAQVFITGIERKELLRDFNACEHKVFHVKQGDVFCK